MRIRRTIGRLGAVLAVTLVAMATTLTPAQASPYHPYEENMATPTSNAPPSSAICDSYFVNQGYRVEGCFERYGDRWWVKSQTVPADPYAVAVIRWENELLAYGGPSGWEIYRDGLCHISRSQVWNVCEKDYYENSSTNYFGRQGSRLSWRLCHSTFESQCGGTRVTVNNA